MGAISGFITAPVPFPGIVTHGDAVRTSIVPRRERRCQSYLSRVQVERRVKHVGGPTMQLPPPGIYDVPLSDEDIETPEYRWQQEFPGTLKPGLVDDNFPLQRVLDSGVYKNMVYDEFDMDERYADIFEPDEDLLEWLAKEGRLIARDAGDEEFDTEAETQISSIADDDLDYADDDSKMLAYYSRQSGRSSFGADLDFGGFSESTTDYDSGF